MRPWNLTKFILLLWATPIFGARDSGAPSVWLCFIPAMVESRMVVCSLVKKTDPKLKGSFNLQRAGVKDLPALCKLFSKYDGFTVQFTSGRKFHLLLSLLFCELSREVSSLQALLAWDKLALRYAEKRREDQEVDPRCESLEELKKSVVDLENTIKNLRFWGETLSLDQTVKRLKEKIQWLEGTQAQQKAEALGSYKIDMELLARNRDFYGRINSTTSPGKYSQHYQSYDPRFILDLETKVTVDKNTKTISISQNTNPAQALEVNFTEQLKKLDSKVKIKLLKAWPILLSVNLAAAIVTWPILQKTLLDKFSGNQQGCFNTFLAKELLAKDTQNIRRGGMAFCALFPITLLLLYQFLSKKGATQLCRNLTLDSDQVISFTSGYAMIDELQLALDYTDQTLTSRTSWEALSNTAWGAKFLCASTSWAIGPNLIALLLAFLDARLKHGYYQRAYEKYDSYYRSGSSGAYSSGSSSKPRREYSTPNPDIGPQADFVSVARAYLQECKSSGTVPKLSKDTTIIQAYKILALVYHPDKRPGGSDVEMKKLAAGLDCFRALGCVKKPLSSFLQAGEL